MNIEEIRAKFPQYSDLSDADLAKGLHQKFYSDMPFNDFASKIGFSTEPAVKGDASRGGMGASAWRGVKDIFVGGDQLLTHAATKFRLPKEEAVKLDAQIQADEQQFQADRTAAGRGGIDWARMGGNMLTTAPAMLIPGANTIAGAGAVGALTSALQPVTQGDYWSEKGKQAAIGGAAGAAGGAIAKGVGRVLSPKIGEAQKELVDAGVQLTPGQLSGGIAKNLEDKATSLPIAGSMIDKAKTKSIETFNRATYDKVLAPVGEKLPEGLIGREAAKHVGDSLSTKYDTILAQMNTQVDGPFQAQAQFISSKITSLPDTNARQFVSIVKDNLIRHFDPQGQMTGEQMKTAVKELGRLGVKYKGSQAAGEQELGDLILQMQTAVKEMAARSNPTLAPELANVDKAWAMFTRTRTAGAALGAKDGVFTPAQLLNAVKAGDKSGNKSAFFKGDALMQDWAAAADRILPNKVPDSGTAGRAGLGALLTGAAGFADPMLTAGALGGISAAYTNPGQATLRALLSARPQAARTVGDLIGNSGPLLAPPLTEAGYSLLNQ